MEASMSGSQPHDFVSIICREQQQARPGDQREQNDGHEAAFGASRNGHQGRWGASDWGSFYPHNLNGLHSASWGFRGMPGWRIRRQPPDAEPHQQPRFWGEAVMEQLFWHPTLFSASTAAYITSKGMHAISLYPCTGSSTGVHSTTLFILCFACSICTGHMAVCNGEDNQPYMQLDTIFCLIL